MKSWSEVRAAYIRSLRAIGRRPSTIRVHEHYVRRLAETAKYPGQLTVESVEQALAVSHWMPETRKSAQSVFRGFSQWCVKRGILEVDPTIDLPTVTVPMPIARPTPQTIADWAIRSTRGRSRWLVLLAVHGGLRCAEIAQVHRDDLLPDDVLMVLGKGGKQRVVPLVDSDLAHAIRTAPDEGWLFPGRTNGHLSPGHVSKLLADILPGDWTAHTLRHRMACNGYAKTRDLLAVGRVLGHSKPETTMRYVQMPLDTLWDVVRGAMG